MALRLALGNFHHARHERGAPAANPMLAPLQRLPAE
jgi:hypothetical protein